MANEDIKAKVAELRSLQLDIRAACATQNDGWRYAVVAGRRAVGTALGELSAMVAQRSAAEGLNAVRNAVSVLRAALAEHQATWPAVSIEPTAPAYVTSVTRVRAAYDHLDAVLADHGRPQHPTLE